jgi:hypothetical protein
VHVGKHREASTHGMGNLLASMAAVSSLGAKRALVKVFHLGAAGPRAGELGRLLNVEP